MSPETYTMRFEGIQQLAHKLRISTVRLQDAFRECAEEDDTNFLIKEKTYTFEGERKMNSKAYKPWTNEDDSQLEEAHRSSESMGEMMRILGRSAGSIKSRLSHLGLEK